MLMISYHLQMFKYLELFTSQFMIKRVKLVKKYGEKSKHQSSRKFKFSTTL